MSTVLNDLRNLTVISKKLSEVHFKTLTNFCFIALENIDKVEIDYCIDPSISTFSGSSKGYIKFIIYKKNARKTLGNKIRNQYDRFSDVKNWTESIFWKDIEISFVDNKDKRLDVKPNSRAKKISS